MTAASGEPEPPGEAPEELLFEGRGAVLSSVGAVLLTVATLGIAALVLWFRRRSVGYRVTSQRIVIERGILSQRLEQTDIYRIVDYTVERPFGQRLLGTGNLVLKTMEKENPVVRIDAVRTDVVALYERLRRATEAEKRRRGVRIMDCE
jgi:uncharacterized membrane protein YdbT with pleckstrin-like domain